ncbi:RabGAP-TBC domain-containing protein [Cephalotus follicularis]|uniref:RabGAP-TBC domain-containing protein n=1 Tax=Cephalotus follicularis TaxID=3775 RepID=A0A1Q3CVB9_CEPFO|nr:RabGAP-TBC domain-containing protein [Cephalotus follicularis]
MLLSLLSRRTLEVDSRDSYGFTLRPQHIQRYREYTNIYEEEEEERSHKWKIFLERQAQSSQPIYSEEEHKETVQARDTESKAKTVSENSWESDDSSGEKSESDGSTECTTEKEVQLPGELQKEVQPSEKPEKKLQLSECKKELQLSGEPKKDEQLSGESNKEVQPSEETAKEVQHLEDPQKEVQPSEQFDKQQQLPEEPVKELQLSVELEKEVQHSENPEKKLQLSEHHEKDLQLSGEPKKDVQLSGESNKKLQPSEKPEKEVQHLEDRQKEVHPSEQFDKQQQLPEEPVKELQLSEDPVKRVQLITEAEKEGIFSKETVKVQSWGQIRLSLGSIETMMSFRVKKTNNMDDEQISVSENHLPSINESGSSGRETEEEFEEEARVSETTDDPTRDPRVDSATGDDVSVEPFFPWKEELECLVRGGVPKDLRGEVWQAFVGVKARRMETYYQELLAEETDAGGNKEHSNSSGVPKKWKKQIEKDIPRTFPGHPALDENGRDSLRRLLLAYARHNPSVGYCQAMNFFAGILLLLMPEENAFWALVGIIDDYFEGYYTEEMIESQVDQLVFEDLMRERFPKLVNHLDYLGVQVAWISGPWFLSIFVNMLPWESVLRIWDVLLFEGNRVMLFRTALALMELYGPALVTTKDAGDAINLLQSLAGSTFDSSQLVLTACMGYLAVTEARLQELREKHRPAVLVVVEERSKRGRVWKDSKGLASKLYSFKHDPGPLVDETEIIKGGDAPSDGDNSHLGPPSSNLDDLLGGLTTDSEVESLPDLQEQVVWLKVELCRLLQERRSATLRAEDLETAFVELVKQDNRRQLSARIEQLEQEVADLKQALADKKEQESAMLQVLMRVEQEQRITEDARRSAEQVAATQKYAVHVLEEKYEKAMALVAQMEKKVVMAESTLEATLQYQSGQNKALSSPRSIQNQGSSVESPRKRTGLLPFALGWRDRNK